MLSFLYGLLINLRNKLYDIGIFKSYKSSLKTICVGNVTVGGNGKTPLVVFLAKELEQRGCKPVVLSRGYKGKIRGPHLVSDANSAKEVGDEPLLIHRKTKLPVVVAKDRVAGAKFIEKQQLGDLIILDDGFQHRRLDRDVNILSFDVSSKKAIDKVKSGKLLPAGRLREPLESALKRTNVIVYANRSSKKSFSSEFENFFPDSIPVFETSLAATRPVDAKEVVAISGLANPEAFYGTLEELGYDILDRRSFPDHYGFTEGDISKIKEEYPNTPIVCTEKDLVKLPEVDLHPLAIETKINNFNDFAKILTI